MSDLDGFRAFYALADRLIAESSKESIAEAARRLVLNLAHYQSKYGALPFEDFAGMLRADSIDGETEVTVRWDAEPRGCPRAGHGAW